MTVEVTADGIRVFSVRARSKAQIPIGEIRSIRVLSYPLKDIRFMGRWGTFRKRVCYLFQAAKGVDIELASGEAYLICSDRADALAAALEQAAGRYLRIS